MSGYGYAFIPHEIYYEPSRTPPERLQNIVQAETINGSETICPLGLFGYNGCGYAAVYEGYGLIHAD
jgi:hypothetical protein